MDEGKVLIRFLLQIVTKVANRSKNAEKYIEKGVFNTYVFATQNKTTKNGKIIMAVIDVFDQMIDNCTSKIQLFEEINNIHLNRNAVPTGYFSEANKWLLNFGLDLYIRHKLVSIYMLDSVMFQNCMNDSRQLALDENELSKFTVIESGNTCLKL